MKVQINKTRVMTAVFFLLLISCATTPKTQPSPPLDYLFLSCATTPNIKLPPPEGIRTDLGNIGIASARFQPEVKIRKGFQTRGEVASDSARGWAKVCATNLVSFSACAVIGGILAAVTYVSRDKFKEPEDALNGLLATVNFQETMRDRFMSLVSTSKYSFVFVEERGPAVLDEHVAYDSLSDRGIDTVLEISVLNGGLGDIRETYPYLRLHMDVGIKIIRTRDAKVLHSCIIAYRYDGPYRHLSEWGANNAELFGEELDCAFLQIAAEILKTLSVRQVQDTP